MKQSRVGTICKVVEPTEKADWWVKGMNKYIGEVGEVVEQLKICGHKVMSQDGDHKNYYWRIEGFNGRNEVPYWFPDECLIEV